MVYNIWFPLKMEKREKYKDREMLGHFWEGKVKTNRQSKESTTILGPDTTLNKSLLGIQHTSHIYQNPSNAQHNGQWCKLRAQVKIL